MNYLSNQKAAEEVLAQISRDGGRGELAAFDVADAKQVRESIGPLLERQETVDVLVNNAGVTADGLLAMMSEENWHRVVDTSLGRLFQRHPASSDENGGPETWIHHFDLFGIALLPKQGAGQLFGSQGGFNWSQ